MNVQQKRNARQVELEQSLTFDEVDLQRLATETERVPYRRFLLANTRNGPPALVVLSHDGFRLLRRACEELVRQDDARSAEDAIQAAFEQLTRKESEAPKARTACKGGAA
jgi:hypothetical protein